jgi:hypothetical protein
MVGVLLGPAIALLLTECDHRWGLLAFLLLVPLLYPLYLWLAPPVRVSEGTWADLDLEDFDALHRCAHEWADEPGRLSLSSTDEDSAGRTSLT